LRATVNLIGSGSLAPLGHPDERDRFVREPGLAEVAVEELLRHTSPVEIATPRLTRENVGFGSVTIPRGEFVGVVLGSANHDEALRRARDAGPRARSQPARRLRHGPPLLPRGQPDTAGGGIALETLFRLPTLRLTVPADAVRWRKTLPL